ncbi:hypothetical protein WM41_0852 [Corynebacterium simulans]|uniref:Nucleotidyltransferase n=1 Tax=Corynebacterium simulans TaxID=146827 RepID=A0ABR5VAV0_9CORY|nr:hypothetical protein WM41_0852 [Corynebacterium simulans]
MLRWRISRVDALEKILKLSFIFGSLHERGHLIDLALKVSDTDVIG